MSPILDREELAKLGAAVNTERAAQKVDVSNFLLDVVRSKGLDLDVAPAILSGNVRRTIEGASTVTIVIDDPRRRMINSGIFGDGTEDHFFAIDVQFDGFWFRLCQVEKMGGEITLTFQDRVVSYLQLKNKARKVSRNKMTRAQFVRSMLKEVKATKISLVTLGQLNKKQPIEKLTAEERAQLDGTGGESEGGGDGKLTVKGSPASKAQISNAKEILVAGAEMGARRKVLLSAIMVAIVEAELNNRKGTDDTIGTDSTGIFQQRDSWGPAEKRNDVTESAKLYFTAAMIQDKLKPQQSAGDLAASVQNPKAEYRGRYAEREEEAREYLDEFANGDLKGGEGGEGYVRPYEFHRGQPDGPLGEDSWAAIMRLAEEVNWRAWSNGSNIYFVRDVDLMKRTVRATIEEGKRGIEEINWEIDANKTVNEAEVICDADRWSVAPGQVVKVVKQGPASGKWLVAEIDRDLFSTDTTIKLIQPEAVKKEPAPEVVTRSNADDPNSEDGIEGTVREKIVAYAKNSLSTKTKHNYYSQAGELTFDPTPPQGKRSDCSQWVRAIYHQAGAGDPGTYTGAQMARGKITNNPKPGDLLLSSSHVELYIGDNRTIGHGSPPIDFDVASDWVARGMRYYTYDFLDGE